MKTPAHLGRKAGADEATTDRNFADISAAAQRARLLDALRIGSVSTIEARRHLEVLHPAMRVLELRAAGHNIHTAWDTQAGECGVKHRVARYVLLPTTAASLQLGSAP